MGYGYLTQLPAMMDLANWVPLTIPKLMLESLHTFPGPYHFSLEISTAELEPFHLREGKASILSHTTHVLPLPFPTQPQQRQRQVRYPTALKNHRAHSEPAVSPPAKHRQQPDNGDCPTTTRSPSSAGADYYYEHHNPQYTYSEEPLDDNKGEDEDVFAYLLQTTAQVAASERAGSAAVCLCGRTDPRR